MIVDSRLELQIPNLKSGIAKTLKSGYHKRNPRSVNLES
jgi:hypothetical protein